mmetsp:Transcript_43329/g.114046  ORF Transcript_43329/g.114046 Transcript_43329/m.114046 type:complete len:92 (+) Transcript_43329:642-917(+)
MHLRFGEQDVLDLGEDVLLDRDGLVSVVADLRRYLSSTSTASVAASSAVRRSPSGTGHEADTECAQGEYSARAGGAASSDPESGTTGRAKK